ncbi:fumarylacetoacetate hydrolase family protein [Altererythrobacter sp. H2]|uniref:fumarylacetoacetate hydrolase family protein n=1 Tax=Altererythrobacter sp. H2 TaxID=3108391 RepID=UPI002B4C1B7B|nr:fumarylacetoacetate hydrolase family protein [Altererythrobacter sp. H2]WRK95669.1 fumarylacetoacetate hydrolase family protein [Altererythrobacter sp. H2]
MVRQAARIAGIVLLILVIGVALAWATSPDPRGNRASFEAEPLTPVIAPLDEAFTLAQRQRSDGSIATYLVIGLERDVVRGIDLAALGAEPLADPFAALASLPAEAARPATLAEQPILTFSIADLLPAAGPGTRHVATGTNIAAHAEEAGSDTVFQFPKFGAASPALTTVRAGDDVLLDYEVELCMRFDRPVASASDFDAAQKGLFLCGDFTNRATLARMADPDNLDSGRGFSDAKSGPDFFPSGALLVIPRDWRAFVDQERFTTTVNDQPRQDARGREMTLDFRALAEKALSEPDQARFVYREAMHRLAPAGRIMPDMVLMSGTAEGVIFTPPSRADMIEGVLDWALGGGRLALRHAVIERFIANERKSGHFLQPGDRVGFASTHLGTIHVDVTGD